MAWTIDFDRAAERDLKKLDPEVARRLLAFLHDRLAPLRDVRKLGEALRGSTLGEFWKYRVGDYRLICHLEDKRLRVLVVKVGHRRQVYR
ncbi:MAG: type II toxin-antitoxin system RelE/ParE family toxin [Steroidobacteraceae bacterium]